MNAEVFGMLHGEFVGNPTSIIERLCPRPRRFVGNTLLVWIDSVNTVVRILWIHTLVHRYPFVVGAVPRLLDSTRTLKRNTSTYLIPRASKRASGSGRKDNPIRSVSLFVDDDCELFGIDDTRLGVVAIGPGSDGH